MVDLKNIPCIILAGGFGTRLQSVVSEVAKPMAKIGHKPFLHILLDRLHQQGLVDFILSIGYKHESIVDYFDELKLPYSIKYSVEDDPLGTGGAIRKAMQLVKGKEALVCNGDTFFDLNFNQFLKDKDTEAAKGNLSLFMALKVSKGENRFGNVNLEKGRIISFGDPETQSNFQNAGVYWFEKTAFIENTQKGPFSLELDYFPQQLTAASIGAAAYETYFIDMGIPEDYDRAKKELATFFIDDTCTLFLDRDGVINTRIIGGYVKEPSAFHFIDGAKDAIVSFSKLFGRIIVVTNQQGIGKGLMTERNLEEVHRYMRTEIENAGGKIDAIYFAPDLSQNDPGLRKPATGMAFLAKDDFPEINFSKSVMIGDSDSDIEFGNALGMITVKVRGHEETRSNPSVLKEDLLSCCSVFEKVPARK